MVRLLKCLPKNKLQHVHRCTGVLLFSPLTTGDYHAHTDTREQMQRRLAEHSAASSTRQRQPSAAEASPEAESSDGMEEVCWTTCCIPGGEHGILRWGMSTIAPIAAPVLVHNNRGVQDMFQEESPRSTAVATADSIWTGASQPLSPSSSDQHVSVDVEARSHAASSGLAVPAPTQLASTASATSDGPVTERACTVVN